MLNIAKALLCVFTSLTLSVAATQYNERYRPGFHFSPAANWTNDPCGLVYAFGNYHLFFQHNPFANVWGHMSWGHAESRDLVHWKQLPVAIPEGKTVAIFTGSSVFDAHNTSGLCKSAQGCIVSIYTGYTPKTSTTPDKQTQNLAYSEDGVTWTKYSRNPVLDLHQSDTRDPKVFWYAPRREWIMVIVHADEKKIQIFRSANLKTWSPESEFGPLGATGGQWECPDLYSIPVDGSKGETRWILKIGLNPGHIAGGSGEQYFVGRFDGRAFSTDNPNPPVRWLDYGRDSYCALTFNDEPNPDVHHLIGWMNNWQYAAKVPTAPWRGQMTLPRTLSLARIGGELQLLQHPIKELQVLRQAPFRYEGASVDELNQKLANWHGRGQMYELEAAIDPGQANEIAWDLLRGDGDQALLGFDAMKHELFFDRTHSGDVAFSPAFPSRTAAPLDLHGSPLELHVFVDRLSVEAFAQKGAISMTNLVFPKASSTGLSLHANGGAVGNMSVTVWPMRSAWDVVRP